MRGDVEALHQSTLLLAVLLAPCTASAGSGHSVHTRVFQYLDELTSESADVLLDLVYVVLRDSLPLGFALLHGDVAPHEIAHDALIAKVPLLFLLYFTLKNIDQMDFCFFRVSRGGARLTGDVERFCKRTLMVRMCSFFAARL